MLRVDPTHVLRVALVRPSVNEKGKPRVAFGQLDRKRLHEQVAEQIRESILCGELGPGQSLPTERDLSLSFGVSRASIREALRALEAQGFVSMGRGGRWPAVVADDLSGPMRQALEHLLRLRRVGLWDLVELRSAVESAALARAAGGPDPARLEEARRALDIMRRPGTGPEEFDRHDLRFHLALVASAGNEAMDMVMLAVHDPAAAYLLEALRSVPDPDATLRRLVDEHAAILKAVEDGEAARAAALVRDHIERFYHVHLHRSAADGEDAAVTGHGRE